MRSDLVVAAKTRQTAQVTRAERVVARMLPSLTDLIFVCILFAVFLGLQGKALGDDGDAAWNLRIGEQILSHGLPRTEFLLSTAYGQPTVHWEWLAQVVYALAARLGGLNGVVALAGALVAATCAGVFAITRRRGVPLLPALALALAATALTSITWTARAQLYSLPLTLWWSNWLWRYRRDGDMRRLFAFPLVMALWANLHAGFIGGLILLTGATAAFWLFPRARGHANPRHLALTLIATLAATLATPWGLSLWFHILTYARNPLISRYTQEYQSPDFHGAAGLLFLALALAVIAAWLWCARRGIAPDALAVVQVGVWTALAFVSVRFVPLWALIATPFLAEALTSAWRARSPVTQPAAPTGGLAAFVIPVARGALERVVRLSRRLEATETRTGRGLWTALALAAVLLLLVNGGALPGASASTTLADARFDARAFPVQAAARLHAAGLPAGTGFTTYTWGGYLDEALPEYRPFIDSRSDVYSQQLLSDYADIVALRPNWQQLLARYGVRWALVPRDDALTQALQLAPDWRCAPADDVGVATLCQRTAPA